MRPRRRLRRATLGALIRPATKKAQHGAARRSTAGSVHPDYRQIRLQQAWPAATPGRQLNQLRRRRVGVRAPDRRRNLRELLRQHFWHCDILSNLLGCTDSRDNRVDVRLAAK